MVKSLIIFGSKEMAELAKFYFENDTEYRIVAFTVDDAYIDKDQILGIPLIPFTEVIDKFPPENYEIHIALSYNKLNKLRQDKYDQVKSFGYKLPSYICSKAVTWPGISIGDNCFILENQTIQPSVQIGNNVILWSGNHIGHGTTIEDHVYISSEVVISGHCRIGKRSFLGVNAAIKDFLEIGSDCFIGMGASVTMNMSDGSIALGSSADIFPPDDKRSRLLKRKFFGL